MIDTAVDADLPALAGVHLRQRSFVPPDQVRADPDHGTAIAALLAGQSDAGGSGLLPGVELRVAQIFARDGDGHDIADSLAFAAALDWLSAEKTPVVNLSVTGPDNMVIALAVRRAAARGMMLVAAAGNDGPGAGPAYPAAYPSVLAVAAIDAHRNPDPHGNRGDYIAFAAPGLQIWTPSRDGGRFHSGSSFAAPFLAAALTAELMAGQPPDRARLERRLASSAIDLGPPGRDPIFGWGLLHVHPRCAIESAATK
jgi:subtilisin family serine protease